MIATFGAPYFDRNGAGGAGLRHQLEARGAKTAGSQQVLEKMMGNVMDYKDYQEFYILCNSLSAINYIFLIFFINYIFLFCLSFISLYYNKHSCTILINIYLFYLFIFMKIYH